MIVRPRRIVRAAVAVLLALLCCSSAASAAVRAVTPKGFFVLVTSTAPTLASRGQSMLWRMTPAGAATRLLVHTGATGISTPALSPDGKQIAYVIENRSLWTMSVDGTGVKRLYAVPATSSDQITGPRYTPDGASIAFVQGCCGAFATYSIGTGGKHLHQFLAATGIRILQDWSPSGAQALYTVNGALWTIDARGGHAHALGGDAPEAGTFLNARYSPDGTHIVATLVPAQGSEGGSVAIVLMHTDGQYLTVLTKDIALDVGSPCWSPDGKMIAFTVASGPESPLGREHDLWIMRYDGSQKHSVTLGKLGNVVAAVWGP